MKKAFYILLSIVCLLGAGLTSCKKKNQNSIDSLYWVEGEWKGRVKGGMKFEFWKFGKDSTMVGYGCTVSNGDTVFKETMEIVKKEGEVFYVVEVDHNEGPISFKMIENSSQGCVFENLEHDYPTRIVYANTLGDMLLARIEGVRENGPDTARFFMHRNTAFTER